MLLDLLDSDGEPAGSTGSQIKLSKVTQGLGKMPSVERGAQLQPKCSGQYPTPGFETQACRQHSLKKARLAEKQVKSSASVKEKYSVVLIQQGQIEPSTQTHS